MNWNAEVGLRPVGAIEACAPEGMRNWKGGMWNAGLGIQNREIEKNRPKRSATKPQRHRKRNIKFN